MKILLSVVAMLSGLAAPHALAQTGIAAELSVATCVVDNDAARVRKLLRTVPGSPVEAKASVSLVQLYGACDDNRNVSGALAWRERASIAHAAALAALTNGKPDMIAPSAATKWVAMPAASAVAERDYSSSSVGMLKVGICLVRATPEGSLALLQSAPGSTAEAQAVRTVAPSLQACIPNGQQFSLKRAELRLLVAEPLYDIVGGTQQ